MTRIRFHGELVDLVSRRVRDRRFEFRPAEGATLKHAIESFGVPHTEIGAVFVDGSPVELDRQAGANDSIEVHPAEPAAPDALPAFLADAHLGGLARRLRLLGFDTILASDASDESLAELADGDGRILLSRDRELLKHRRVTRGRYVRALGSDEQMREVVRRFGLWRFARPFSRCLECNAPLRSADRSQVLERLPPDVAATHDEFTLCSACGRVYWPGSHWRRLRAVVESVMAEAPR